MKFGNGDKAIDNLTLLCSQGQELSSMDDLDTLLERLLDIALQICEGGASSVLLVDRQNHELFFRAARGKSGESITRLRFDANRGIAGWVLENREPAVVNDVSSDSRHYGYIDEQVDFKTRNLICVPVLWKDMVLGVIEVLNKKNRKAFTEQDREYLSILANQAGAAIHITTMMENLHNFFINMLEIFMVASETLSNNQGHTVRVARLATKIARELEVPDEVYRRIYYASLIHEIGHIRLAREQIVGGERHIPTLGSETIRPIKMLKGIPEIIEAYRERWDGTGYPKGLQGEQIPLEARIIALAKDYEEMREEEAYRKQFDPYFQDNFFKSINQSHDPRVVEAFKKIRRREREKQTASLQKV